MKSNKTMLAILCIAAGVVASGAIDLHAVEIPLGTGGNVIYSSGTAHSLQGAIGYVDIDRVFREHPMTRRCREEFKREVEKRRKEIVTMQQSITAAETAILSSTTIINNERAGTGSSAPSEPKALSSSTTDFAPVFPGPAVSTAAVAQPAPVPSAKEAVKAGEGELEQMKKTLAAMKTDFSARLQKDKEDLTCLEEKQTSDVMTDIYYVLEKIAGEEDITVVFDKNNILYGRSVRDITDKALERLKGR